jgi:hypothetical protein
MYESVCITCTRLSEGFDGKAHLELVSGFQMASSGDRDCGTFLLRWTHFWHRGLALLWRKVLTRVGLSRFGSTAALACPISDETVVAVG